MSPIPARSTSALLTATLLPLIIAALGLASATVPARQNSSPAAPYSYVHHPVSTAVPAAQSAFDRGLTLMFAYQPDEAEQSFRQAARLDPSLAMAWWGIGLTLGPNINDPPERPKTVTAAEALARAKVLAAARATPAERDYIAALETRYTTSPEPDFDHLTMAYRDAMRELVHKYPEDADARALFAEAIMDVHPWRLWDAAGNPAPGTQELVDEIQTGLKRVPDHIGLLHFYIHAVEASNDAARALPAARRLASLPMEPAAAHLVHMPAHIYMRTGDWESAVEANDHAVHHALDYKISKNPSAKRACGHCEDFLSYAYMMQGNQAEARKAAEDYQNLTEDPTNSLAVLVRFRLWQEALAFPEPRADLKVFGRSAHAIRGFWHFARGAAFAGSGQLDQAEGELQALNGEASLAPPAANLDGPPDVEHVLDKMSQTMEAVDLKIAAAILGSRIAEARQQMPRAIALMRDAVSLHDQILYSEPPAWFYPVRESLGALLLRAGSAAQAEAVFREDLHRSPNNPRSMLGLSAALEAQGESTQAAEERSRFQTAWRHSDVQIEVGQL
jgi:tetratricopeptide (TPR) repeat protein